MQFNKLLPFLVTALASVSDVVDASACRHQKPHTAVSHVDPVTKLPLSTLSTVAKSKATSTSVAKAVVKPAASTVSSAAASAKSSAKTSASEETSASEVFTGLGTRYGLSDGCTEEDCWQSGACSFVDYDLPSGLDGSTCVSDDIWDDGANCGGCISVTYKGVTLKIMVTNRTGGNATHLDMTPSTWSKLTKGYSGGGVDGIEWEWIKCPLPESTSLQIHMHKGASKYWFAATIENALLRTKKVEVSSDKGKTWQLCTLHDPNMYILDDKTLPDDTAYVRVTDINGGQVVVKDVVLKSGVVTKAT
ncbi:hypothetical protein NW754_005787 [Fusarium falciforme]|uniref:Expansin-like EG45 domain-containing protein n=1 Tax=Fusarium falciforme TaxID=195108 RepID=A0A9W8QVL0_9HYPO|nr:Hypothetical protein NCS54_00625400 [Fusarium falciforme]KAJ4169635.1 hypothetical protein NW754_005787 [Fusarium falciforme]KAJ4180225.1 hypothetical protein NW755_011913 [Fusarium falciforme]KAJ4199061.1 hypothetical protein NW767_008644 [Fusarium falciforme]KAJ4240361.1 hypothetical protein NW757_012539 [Fusarium falciforme]WAO88889.1 Hypothetical protein NCS54_00625400 [Fusarium falciforme]